MTLKRTPTLWSHARNRLTGPDRTAELLLLRSERNYCGQRQSFNQSINQSTEFMQVKLTHGWWKRPRPWGEQRTQLTETAAAALHRQGRC